MATPGLGGAESGAEPRVQAAYSGALTYRSKDTYPTAPAAQTVHAQNFYYGSSRPAITDFAGRYCFSRERFENRLRKMLWYTTIHDLLAIGT